MEDFIQARQHVPGGEDLYVAKSSKDKYEDVSVCPRARPGRPSAFPPRGCFQRKHPVRRRGRLLLEVVWPLQRPLVSTQPSIVSTPPGNRVSDALLGSLGLAAGTALRAFLGWLGMYS